MKTLLNIICDEFPFDIFSEIETNVKSLNDVDSDEDYNLPKNRIMSKMQTKSWSSRKRKRTLLKIICDEIPFDIFGEIETNVKSLNDVDSDEDYNLPKNEIMSKMQAKSSSSRKKKRIKKK